VLVIGFKPDNSHASRELDVDPTIDSARKIHDLLKKATDGSDYSVIVCIEDDKEVASFVEYEDYDLSDDPEVDELDEDDDNPDNLHSDDEESDDDNGTSFNDE
jgi:hypothetical protein